MEVKLPMPLSPLVRQKADGQIHKACSCILKGDCMLQENKKINKCRGCECTCSYIKNNKLKPACTR